MARRLPPRLIALTPGRADGARAASDLLARLREYAEAGLEGCLVREPGLDDRDLSWLARELRDVFPVATGRWLAVHDRVHVALTSGADAVHLGFRSLRPLEARRAIDASLQATPVELAIGLSTHAHDDATEWAGADYLFHGPIFETPSKVGLVSAVGPEGLAEAARRRPDPRVPLYALGGVTAARLPLVLEAGADGVAVLGALFGPDGCREELKQLVSTLASVG